MLRSKNKKNREKLFAKTRRLSRREGAVASVMFGINDNNITPYAVELGASTFSVGLLNSLVNLFGPLSQIFGSKLLEKYHRKKIVFWTVMLQASACLLLAWLGLSFLDSQKTLNLVPALILSSLLYIFFGSLASPAWFSLIGDAVPENTRGKYFSHRNRLALLFWLSATLVSAFILQYFQSQEIILGFVIIFVIAALARYVSAFYLNRHYVEELKLSPDYYFPFWRFISGIKNYNFNKFALFTSAMVFATNIAGPFFAVYLWQDLKFPPVLFMITITSWRFFSFLFYPLWGHFADKYGNRELLRLGTLLIIPMPFLWLFSTNPFYLIFVPQLVSGAGWAAFELAASNFIYDSIKPQRRALIVAYYNFLNGLGLFLGAILGGLLAQYINFSFINSFLFIFIISGTARLIMGLIFLPPIKEVRTIQHSLEKNPLNYLKEIKNWEGTFFSDILPLKSSLIVRLKNKIKRKKPD
ncbi:MAG: MFS transporter [Patescibacteria group bacterium]|jgi:MFS family permease